MIKLSRTGITTLKKQYKSVLLKCLLINAGILFAATGANAADFYVAASSGGTNDKGITVGGGLNTGSSGDGIYVNYNTDTMNVGTDGKLTLSDATVTSLGKANTALQSTSALNGANLTAGTVAKTALATDVQTSLGKADGSAQVGGNNTYSGNNIFNGTVTMSQGLSLTGGELTTTGGATIGGAATIGGNTTVGGSLGVTGALTGSTATFSGAVSSLGLNAGAGNIETTAALKGGTLATTGIATVGGTLTTTGMTYANGGLTTNSLVLGSNTLSGVDKGESAISTGSASTIATTATVLTSAGNGAFNPGSSTVLSGKNTIKDAITALGGAVDTNNTDIANLKTATTFTADGNYYAQTDTVAAATKKVDAQVKTNTTDIADIKTVNTAQDTKLAGLATAIGGSYDPSTNVFTKNSYGSANTISDGQSLVAAVGALDGALGKVSTAKSAVAGASSATDLSSVVAQLSANLTNGTIDANFGNTTVDSLTIDGTSYGIKSTGAATFASTTTDSLKIGSANAISSTVAKELDMNSNSLKNVADIASTALTTSDADKTVTIGGTGYTTTVTGDEVVTGKLGVTGDFAVNTNKFTVAAETGNTSIAGTLGVTGATTLGSTLGVTGATTLSDTLSVAGKTTLSNANGLAFDDAATTVVNSIDNGSAAKTTTSANNATTMATVATVLKSAENAVYTGTATKDKTGTAPATISAALDLIGDVKALTTSDNFTNAGAITVATVSDALQGIDATLGKIHGLASTSGTVTPSAGITSTVGSGTNLARGTTVEAHLVSLDNAIGNRTSGFATNKPVDYADTALNGKQDLVTVISQVASNVGVAADLTTAGTNGVAATNTVNKNIDTVNKNLGDVQAAIANSHYGTGAGDLSSMVGQVDNKLYALDRDVRKLKKEFKGGMASMAAMTALVPNARAHGNTQVSIGTGAYDGHTAAAIGGFHWINDNLLLNIGVSYADTSKAAYRAGVTWSW